MTTAQPTLIGFVVLETRVEPVLWKVMVAATAKAAVLLGLGLIVRLRQAAHSLEEAR